jgi:hypothetical protein
MERVVLNLLGGNARPLARRSRPPVSLADLDDRLSFLQANALDQSTVRGYAVGARDYLRFCLQYNLPLDPTPLTLARYIAHTSRFIASGPRYLTGARHFLRNFFPDFDSIRANPLVKSTIRGSLKIRADPVQRKLPLRTSHLQTFLHVALQSQCYDDLLFVTILSSAFYACHRIGELVPATGLLFDWRKIIKRSSLVFPGDRVQYRLPYHKGDPFFRGSDILLIPQTIADPVLLLRLYTQLRDRIHGARSPLFLRENGQHPTRAWFDKRFFAVMDRSYGGQSARAGGATFYASLGVSEDVLQAIGRWSSSAWKIYIRDHPVVRMELQLALLRFHNTLTL